ncbi:MAG: TetR/AcrR family transcriptional regulator [Pigmentiphaga sp.]|uniref:TetR/AcrR family transcriptional regulator n=1 Tax=Pigmentiphaga sp. TaxID=1977564 RepID=UPI0029AF4B8B|nr:TetR/AcrR family transcriptional regulator [Pigmentiphaga sp.]MDX3907306.1 TetR/AcrR family transcriptional regulator [Pigmentiphaga sp.]
MASRTPSRPKAAAPARRAPRDSVATRTAILDSAEKIFARDGLRSTRTEEIAAGSGVTKAMIHYYFDTKEALYQAVLDRVFKEREEGMDFGSLRQLPPAEALRAFVERLLQQMVAKPHLGPLFALENIQNDGAFYNRNGGKVYRTLADIIERGVADGSFRPQDPGHAAVNIMGACVHFFNVSSNIRTLWPKGKAGAAASMNNHWLAVVEFVMHAVLAPSATGRAKTTRHTRLAAL